MLGEGAIFGHVCKVLKEFLSRGVFCHFETELLEVVLQETFYQFVLLSDFLHEVLENLMGRCSRLRGIHHGKQCFLLPELHQEVSPLRFVAEISICDLLSEEFPVVDAIDSFPQSSLLGLLFFPNLFYLKDILQKGGNAIVGMQSFEILILFVLMPDIIPPSIVLHVLLFETVPEGFTILLFYFIGLFFFFVVEFIHIVLKSVLALMLIEQSPSGVGDEVISDSVHLAVRCQGAVLFEHLQKLDLVDLGLGSFLNIACFF